MSRAQVLKHLSHKFYEKGGIYRLAIVCARRAKNLVVQFVYNLRVPTFEFRGKHYKYFYHRYNRTWLNERMVEVPLAADLIRRYSGKRVLEVGNVLAHYFPRVHDALDKYEKGAGVINEDAATFRPAAKYDLIVSISTLEHVGYDEEEKDEKKIITAIKNLRDNCLKDGGLFFVTMPLGYNPAVDRFLAEKVLPLGEIAFLKRTSAKDRWREAGYGEVKNAKYGSPYEAANAILIGTLRK